MMRQMTHPGPEKPNEGAAHSVPNATNDAPTLSGENAARAVEKAEQRAERRLGEILKVERDAGRLAGQSPGEVSSSTEPTLSDIGVDKKLSARAGKLG